MWFPQFALFVWSLHALTLYSDALKCPKGQRVLEDEYGNQRCGPCPTDSFQPEENTSLTCRPCNKCFRTKGSEEREECTPVSDRKCRCRENFYHLKKDFSACKCGSGFTLQGEDCVKVEEKPPAKTTSPRPKEGTPTQKPAPNITIAAITIAPNAKETSTTTTTTKEKKGSHGSSIVVGFICLMVLLLALTALFCRRNVLSRAKRATEQSRETSFRVPVEESGDGSQDPLKQNQEEP